MKELWCLSALLALMTFSAGCVGPRYVAASTGSKGQVKFLWTNGGGDQGIVKCAVDDVSGDLDQCRDVTLVLED